MTMNSEMDRRIRCPLATRLLRVVFGVYLLVVLVLTTGQMLVEYQHQENSIRREFANIQKSFEHVLAGQIWNLDEPALLSTVQGIIELPVIVGMKITDANNQLMALGGMVQMGPHRGVIDSQVRLQGFAQEVAPVASDRAIESQLFETEFPIIYTVNQSPRVLGRATLYSNASVVFNRVQTSFLLLGIKTVLEISLLWLIFKWVFTRLLNRPLAELTTAVERVTLDDLAAARVSVPVGCRDELGVLAEAFNQMLSDLRQEMAKRRTADESLAASESKLNSILRVAPAGIGLIKDRVFTAVNPSLCGMTGYNREELLGQSSRLLYQSEEDFRGVAQQMYAQIAQGGMGKIEVTWRRKDGQPVHMLLLSAPLDPSDPHSEITTIAMDVTERKRAEAEKDKLQAQLLHAQKMESVGRLAGGVAHDFNNMLQVISGNLSLALLDLPEASPVRDSLREAQTAARRSADLTRQLLAFARKQAIAPKVLDLNQTVAGMHKMLRRLIGEDIDLTWKPGADLWSVRIDPSQLDQILANLCVNARDAIKGVGLVTIETSNVTLDDTYAATHPEVVAGEYVLLAVSDTGKGMDAETRSHLFEPFFTTKEQGKGTGLGLATVFGIVKQNHGLISVYSEPGQGSTFKVYLPRTEASTPPQASGTRPQDWRGTETVLLVEDEEQVLNLARRILQQQGYTVLTASTPEAAVELAKREAGRIHLLITDVVMPGMNGRELGDCLKAFQPNLRCLYLSGYTADVMARRGVLEEGVPFLQKPFTFESLAKSAWEVLNSATAPRRQDAHSN